MGVVPRATRRPARRTRRLLAARRQQNHNQPPLARANELLAALSTDQKIELALGNFSAVKSSSVPVLNFTDGPDGVRNAGTTAIPSAEALAASSDRSLAFAYGQVVGAVQLSFELLELPLVDSRRCARRRRTRRFEPRRQLGDTRRHL